uniref:Integrase catalytic domain-containing protein n=1 Tax=Fagus sylvatica TaxID=28930 RepID=A0A2N9HLG9_FAGSY
MEGAPNDGNSADPAMTPIERQMQVIATSIQDLARETSRQNQELWQAIRKGPPTPHDNNQPPPRGGNGSNDQEADSHQVTRRRGGEVERTPPRSRHRAESAGSSAPPSQHKTAKTTRSSKQPERPDRSFKQPERQDRRGSSSRRPDHPAQSSKDPDDKTTCLEKELFKVPLLENFDGTKDPFDYLEAFKTIMQLQAVPEEVMCRAFPLGLRGSARVWFHNKLESESIGPFHSSNSAVRSSTKTLHWQQANERDDQPIHLLIVKQMEGESLRTFVHSLQRICEKGHFLSRTLQGPASNMETIRTSNSLIEEVRRDELISVQKNDTGNEQRQDALEAMDDPPPKRRKETEDRKPEPAKQKVPKFTETPERKRTTAPPVKFSSFTPLNTPIDKLLLQIQEDPSLRWPGKIRSDPNNRPKNLYCRFHRDHGHLTEDCVALKEQVETLIRQGKLQKYVSRPANAQPSLEDQRQEEPHELQGKLMHDKVHNIMVVQRPLKNVRLDDQIISFSEEDARGTHQPHDDALVITVNIAGFTTRRVMVDNGSSADILYLPAYSLPANAARQGQTAPHGCTARRIHRQNQTMTIEEQKILVKPSGELDTIELEDGRPERTTKVGADLPPKMKESLVQFLKENKDVFAWSHEDMPGINPSIISHKLNVDPSLRPIKQKRRVFAPERNNAIMEEVDKLLTANFIREVFYPDWLANVVMVKKSTGKWRMCVDFTDLNKACPKDSFPLPRIDQLVDSTAGHKLLTFMDAFSGYNQIVMDESDQEKTSFITSRGLFCYKVMPFGLKNAGATYQRLMNRMFHDQIGRNVEVYVDDMLVKSKEEDVHLDDLRETFQTLRKYQMKLNPSKCAFGVYSGKFLGFMVSQRGIEANPDKIKAILEMQPPKSTKEVQRLTGRVAALNRFMSRSTDKCLPFFKTLKKAFEWTDECQQAFEELKRYLTEPPLLSPSKQGEELYLYLAVSPTAVSSALIREEERRQLPSITQVERSGGRGKISAYGKASIRPSDGSEKTPPWSIELSEFDIDYRPRTAIKAQALADFIAEFTSKDDEPTTEDVEQTSKWTMNIDGIIDKGLRRNRCGLKITRRASKRRLRGKGRTHATLLAPGPASNKLSQFESRRRSDQESSSNQSLQATEMNPVHVERNWMTLDDTNNLITERDTTRQPTRSQTIKDAWHRTRPSYVMREIHEGICGDHSGARALQRKIVRAGYYYWPSLKADACKFVQSCDKCQRFANLSCTRLRRQLKFLVVAIDYFTKWVEAEPLATITERNIQNFVWKAVICRFGIPRVLVSDNGKQFDNPRFRQFSQELGIHNHYSSPGHPQANGQVEVTNRSLLKLIKTRLEGAKGLWPEELPSILWAYRTTVRIPTGETPFRMTFGSEAVVPVRNRTDDIANFGIRRTAK